MDDKGCRMRVYRNVEDFVDHFQTHMTYIDVETPHHP